eukprot:gene16242-22410_t
MRQITASVTFLPLLETRCKEDSDARSISNAEVVALRGFNTKVHGVKTMVAYKQSDEVL